jgi:hypothetical protein
MFSSAPGDFLLQGFVGFFGVPWRIVLHGQGH